MISSFARPTHDTHRIMAARFRHLQHATFRAGWHDGRISEAIESQGMSSVRQQHGREEFLQKRHKMFPICKSWPAGGIQWVAF
jgi:hypothetical protein